VDSPLLKPVPTGRPSMFDVPRCSDLDILDADLAVVGVPFSVPYDLYRSTMCSTAPQAIREQSMRFAPRYLSHYDFDFGGDLLAGRRVEMVDCGDVATTPSTIQENPGLFCRSAMLRIPVQSPEMWAVVTHSPLNYPHGKDQAIQVRLNLVNLGDAQILTIPGEALPNIGFYLRRKMRGKHNLLFGLTNDAFGYILTKVDFASFPRYEYVSRTSLGEMTGEILIEKWLELVTKSPAPDGSKGGG